MGRPRIHRRDLPERVYFKDGAYYYVHPGTNKWEKLDRDYAKAMARWADILGSPAQCVSVSDLLDRYLLEVVPHKAPRTQEDNRQEIRFLRAFFGGMALSAVKPMHVADYIATRKAKTRGNREVALLSHAFNKAILWELVGSNPCSVPGIRNSETPRDRYVTDEEIEAFKKECPQWLRNYLELKLLLGLRNQDMLLLKKTDFSDNLLRVKTLKTGKTLAIQITPEVKRILDRFTHKSPHLFVTKWGTAFSSNGFASAWRRAMDAYVSTGNQRFHEHDIRGKVATDMLDPRKAQLLLGHKTLTQTEEYMKQRATDVIQPHSRSKK